MTKNAKGCLIFIGIVITIIVFIFGRLIYNIGTSRERADADIAEQQDICQKKLEVPNSILTFEKFKKSEIDNIKIFLIRNNKIIKSVDAKNIYFDENKNVSLSIPFEFLKTDILVLKTNKNLFFELTNFELQTNAEERWTAMGYNGLFEPCSCDLASFRLNKKDSINVISKKNGLKIYDLPK